MQGAKKKSASYSRTSYQVINQHVKETCTRLNTPTVNATRWSLKDLIKMQQSISVVLTIVLKQLFQLSVKRIGVKIFSLAIFILFILMTVAVGNYQQMRKVDNEIADIANYITPIKRKIERVNILALEQWVHFEKILRLYTTLPQEHSAITIELQAIEQKGSRVDSTIMDMIKLSNEALNNSVVMEDIVEFARLSVITWFLRFIKKIG